MPYKFNPFTGNLDIEGPILTGSGTVSAAADGTAAIPGISFASDLNTGIYRPGNDQLAISTGGTGRLFVDSSGNVGINAASTGAVSTGIPVIEIKGNSAAQTDRTGGIRFTRYDGVVGAEIYNADGATYIDSKGIYPLTFYTNGTEKMVLDSSGRLGVGTTSPQDKLQIQDGRISIASTATEGSDTVFGTLMFRNGSNNNRNAKINAYQEGGTSGAGLRFYTRTHGDGTNNDGGIERMRIDSSGNVGIGTSSPSKKLHLKGTNPFILVEADSITGNSGFNFSDGTNKGQILYDHNGDYMRFSTNGSSNERMRIDSSGRLLVGTSAAPGIGTLLHISKASSGAEGAGISLSGIYSLDDDATQSFTVGNGALVFISENNTGDGALFFCGYKSATVTLVADPNNRYANSDTDGKICVFKSVNTGSVTLKNRVGSTKSFTIGKISNSD